jgi:predicted dehydrogenase
MKKVKIGILGAGLVTNTFHMPAFQEVEEAEVVAAFSQRKEVAEEFGKRWKVPKTFHGEDGLEKLCADPDVDLVDIALPNNCHLAATEIAAEHHKSIICERPLARDEQEAKQMLDAVKKHGVLHFYAENQVFLPQIARAKDLIERGMLGQIFWIRCRETQLGQRSSWFWDPATSGGGALLDLGSHSVEIARYMIGKRPVSVLGWASKLVHSTIGEDNGLALVKYEGSELSQTESSWVTRGGLEIRIEVYGGNGALHTMISREAGVTMFTAEDGTTLTGIGERIAEMAQTKKGRIFPALSEHRTLGFVEEFRHFLSSTLTGERALETFEEGYLVNRIIDAAYRSAKSNSWEQIPRD